MSQGRIEKAPDQGLNDLTSTIKIKIRENAQKTNSLFSSACIYRVPEVLRKVQENAYTPRLIAIGPLHRDDKHLQTPLQGIKMSYTDCLLRQLTTVKMEGSEKKYDYSTVLQECVKEMKDCADKARKHYAEELDLSDGDMLEMMLIDGCFILKLLYESFDESKYIPKEAKNKPKEERLEGKRNGASTSSDLSTPLLQASNEANMETRRASKGATRMQTPLGGEGEIKTSCGKKTGDPIWDCNLTANTIKHDLVLLENQIPFFVLEKLFSLTVDRIQNSRPLKFSLDDYFIQYFGSMMSQEGNSTSSGSATATSCGSPSDSTVVRIPPNQMKSSEQDEVVYCHILHKLHDYYLQQTEPHEPHEDHHPQDQTNKKKGSEEEDGKIMPCASELEYAGVKFEPVRGTFNVEFIEPEGPFWWCHRACFKIPFLEIYDHTEVFLRNLIAFEQSCPGVLKLFTSYAFLMDKLVNSDNDVHKLEKAGVIHSYLGARADATNLFNNLCKEVVLDQKREFFFKDMCKKATTYTQLPWPKKLADIERTYFASPRTFIAFVLAFLAFAIQIVTFVQSFL